MRAPGKDHSLLIGLLAALLSGAALVFVMKSRSEGAAQPQGELRPALIVSYGELRLLRTRGASTAPDTVTEVTDFLCPACAAAHRETGRVLDSLVDAGRVVHRVIEVPFQSGALEVSAHASCVWDRDQASYWRLRPVLFDAQRAIAASYPVGESIGRIAAIAGVDTASLAQCMRADGAEMSSRLTQGLTEARNNAVSYTPLFDLNGETVAWSDLNNALRSSARGRE